jgi:hypothetical protein
MEKETWTRERPRTPGAPMLFQESCSGLAGEMDGGDDRGRRARPTGDVRAGICTSRFVAGFKPCPSLGTYSDASIIPYEYFCISMYRSIGHWIPFQPRDEEGTSFRRRTDGHCRCFRHASNAARRPNLVSAWQPVPLVTPPALSAQQRANTA